jgi:hypothetical protein
MILRRLFVALAIAVLFARFVLAWLGGEEATRFLAGNAVTELELVLGGSFVVFHLASVVFVPVLILATAIDWAFTGCAESR